VLYQNDMILVEKSRHTAMVMKSPSGVKKPATVSLRGESLKSRQEEHLFPPFPPLPPFAPIPHEEALIALVMAGQPTMAGIIALLNRFFVALHESNRRLAADIKNHQGDLDNFVYDIRKAFFDLTKEHLLPFDAVYRGRPIFPIREDDSIYISLAAFREHLLGKTLKEVFGKAKHPERIFVGAVVQNCFGVEFTCKTGAQVVGKNKQGRDMTKVSDAPPDANGIEEFCGDENFKKYCDAGQVRALYVNETESLGPAVARYHASKLWGGETYFVQVDSHLEFTTDWDSKYIAEAQAAKSYPKAVLSAYPPGFGDYGDGPFRESLGAKLCSCEFSTNAVEQQIIRVNMGGSYHKADSRPKQIPFMAAGFFFARSELLVDMPFDPVLPWCFMGEEIALSMRAWTSGWNIYAPRKNLIAHQYRPGRMGLPKFWGTVGRLFGEPGPGINTKLQRRMLMRVKNLVGYPEANKENMNQRDDSNILLEIDHYGMGKARTREAYLEFAGIDPQKQTCKHLAWCVNGDYE